MTVDKKEVITLPKWLVILVLPMLVSGLVAYGAMSSWKGTYENKVETNEVQIQRLEEKKVNRDEYNQLINTLNRIENKLDNHISKE